MSQTEHKRPVAAGNLAGLALAPILLHTVGWRGLFYVFGLLGLPLLALWLKVVPQQTPKPRTDGQTVEKLSAVQMMSNSATWAIIAVNFVNHWGGSLPLIYLRRETGTLLSARCQGPNSLLSFSTDSEGRGNTTQLRRESEVKTAEVQLDGLAQSPVQTSAIIRDVLGCSIAYCAGYFIYLNWLPTYFNRVLGVNLRSSALLSFLPWLVMAVGCSLAGIIADKMVASGHPSATPPLPLLRLDCSKAKCFAALKYLVCFSEFRNSS
jgi:MFS family permease